MGNANAANQATPKKAKKKGGMGIRGQMLIKLLPTVIIAMLVLTIVSAINSKNIINNQIQNTMKSELQSNSNQINANHYEIMAEHQSQASLFPVMIHKVVNLHYI